MISDLSWILGATAVVLVLCFGAVLLVGAPYMPTLKKSCEEALDLLDLRPGQTLYELGSGDGVMLKLAAQRGLKVVGYELNPFLVVLARLRTLRYRHQVDVHWGDFWKANLAPADGIFVFLLDKFMVRLDSKIEAEASAGVKLVSHAFKIPGRKPTARRGALFLYKYN